MNGPSPDGAPSRLEAFRAEVERGFDRARIESFWTLLPAFGRIASSGFAQYFLDADLRRIAHDPGFQGDWRLQQLLIARGRSWSLALSLLQQQRRYIHTLPHLGMYCAVGREALVYRRYRLPEDHINEQFDPRCRLIPVDEGVAAPGEVLCLDARHYVYDFVVERPVILLKFSTAAFRMMEWLFNRETLYAWQANDAELSSTQLRVAAYILGRLSHQSSIKPLSQLCAHPHHAVRWAALQGLGRISRSTALKKLEAATQDPHPHLRRAAQATLAQIRVTE